jgi:histidine ammonia-lyase
MKMDNTHYVSTEILTLDVIQHILSQGKIWYYQKKLSKHFKKCRDYLDKKMASHSEPIWYQYWIWFFMQC